MNERPTPETDAAVVASNGQWSFVLKATCERLERERDAERALADRLAGALKNPSVLVAIEALIAWKEARRE